MMMMVMMMSNHKKCGFMQHRFLLLLLLELTMLAATVSVVVAKNYTLGLLVKTYNNEFFRMSLDGCQDFCHSLTQQQQQSYDVQSDDVTSCKCLYQGPLPTEEEPNPDPNGLVQAQMLIDMLPDIDALAVSSRSTEALTAPHVLEALQQANIPVVTFDSDVSSPVFPKRAYVGTDNRFLGTSLAKVAKQIQPNGGTFTVMASDDSPNMMDRIDGFVTEMLAANKPNAPSLWKPLEIVDQNTRISQPGFFDRDVDIAIAMMHHYAAYNPAVICSVNGGPMWSDHYADFYRQHAARNITLVLGDDFPLQLQYLSRGYVSGLVGQMPYEMGFRSARALMDLLQGREISTTIGTNLISHVQVPLVLPELVVDEHLLGNLKYVGFILFGLVSTTVLAAIGWTLVYRNVTVVQAAQPFFLILVAAGVLILGATLIPLSLEDDGSGNNGNNNHDTTLSLRHGTMICMAVPWLSACGFTIVFSALYSKTLRITKLLSSARECQRIQLSATDVLGPFAILLSANLLILSLWTAYDPLHYVREPHDGFDGWNRVISTYGACRSEGNSFRFLIPLAVVNGAVLVLANQQAYLSRRVKSEFAESKYIAFAMCSLLQAFLTGLPVIYVVRDSPEANYLVMSFMVFVICMTVMLLIFVPKMVKTNQFQQRSPKSQRRIMLDSVCMMSTTHNARSRPSKTSHNEDLSISAFGSSSWGQPSPSQSSFGKKSYKENSITDIAAIRREVAARSSSANLSTNLATFEEDSFALPSSKNDHCEDETTTRTTISSSKVQ